MQVVSRTSPYFKHFLAKWFLIPIYNINYESGFAYQSILKKINLNKWFRVPVYKINVTPVTKIFHLYLLNKLKS